MQWYSGGDDEKSPIKTTIHTARTLGKDVDTHRHMHKQIHTHTLTHWQQNEMQIRQFVWEQEYACICVFIYVCVHLTCTTVCMCACVTEGVHVEFRFLFVSVFGRWDNPRNRHSLIPPTQCQSVLVKLLFLRWRVASNPVVGLEYCQPVERTGITKKANNGQHFSQATEIGAQACNKDLHPRVADEPQRNREGETWNNEKKRPDTNVAPQNEFFGLFPFPSLSVFGECIYSHETWL